VGSQRLISAHSGEVSPEVFESALERVLESHTLRNSDALRRLLRFLADKMVAGEADQLKEYSVGIDALGKPSSYDPRRDSTVRIQVGRLRQKLSEYYLTEGVDDPYIIDLPKGRFKITCEQRVVPLPVPEQPIAPPSSPATHVAEPQIAPATHTRLWTALFGAALGIALIWAGVATFYLARERREAALFRGAWTRDLDQLWAPLLSSRRPLIVSIADPPFVQFKGYGAYRDLTLNTWEGIVSSPAVLAIRKALHDPAIDRNVYYAPIGEVSASFMLGKLLGSRAETMALMRASELSFQQLADNNIVYIGAAVFFEDKLRASPVQIEVVNARPGIHIVKPHGGEPATLEDQAPSGAAEDGESYAVVTHVPGPLRTTEILSFTSNRTAGRVAAVEWFANAAYSRTLVSRIRKPSGEIPRYYQIVLKVKYKGGVPTETSYILHHELQ
jgi:hypothetical protein